MSGLHIGQLVICVPAPSLPRRRNPPPNMHRIVNGRIYTVRDLYT